MIRAKTSFLIFVLLFSLIACSQNPVIPTFAQTETFTPFVEGTETALAGPTPWVAGTEMALAAGTQSPHALPTLPWPSPTQPPVILDKPTDFTPVLYGGKFYQTTFFLLLGGASRETWLTPDVSIARFAGEATYSLHTLTQEFKYFVRGNAPEFSPVCKMYSLSTDATLDETGYVGVVDGWHVTKRAATELSADTQLYRQVVSDWLSAEGVSAPEVDAIVVYRVDIEGDGTDEVFISATHLDDSQHTTKAGDYSIVLMRQVVGNEVVTKLIVGDVYRLKEPEITYPRTYSLANFIDLNQDGTLEVVVEIQKWEGFGARVFQIDAEDVIQTLGAEC